MNFTIRNIIMTTLRAPLVYWDIFVQVYHISIHHQRILQRENYLINIKTQFILLRNKQPIIMNYITDRKSTRLNSSHVAISYAVFCLKKKKNRYTQNPNRQSCKSNSTHTH